MLPTQETKDKLDEYINIAYDYISSVSKCQGRWIDEEDMYHGYKSVFPKIKQLSKPCFLVLYAEIKALGHDNPNFFEPKGEKGGEK